MKGIPIYVAFGIPFILAPHTISGALLDVNLTGLFVLAGSTMVGTAFVLFLAQTRDRSKNS
ncbi:MAG: hypothetical protein ACAF41_19085 [Leptolyngbya sp. BL-A-14]